MKKILLVILSGILFAACYDKDDANEFSGRGARLSAERYYHFLCDSDYHSFVDGMYDRDRMDSVAYTQMCDLMAQYLDSEKRMRGGLSGVTATKDSLQDSVAFVFMNVQFGDSTYEQIMTTLVYSKGRWYIR